MPSPMVILSVEAFAIALVPKPNASPISSRLVFVVLPQVPLPSPVPSSVNRKLFTKVLAS